jgi:hypothetical protein
MRKETTLALDKEVYPIEQAAKILELDAGYLLRKSSKGPFKVSGILVERLTPLKKKSGTRIHRIEDDTEWNTIKECSAEIGAHPASIAAWIRAQQKFEFNGYHYEALNYKPIHHVHTKPKRKVQNVETVSNTELQSLGSVPVESTGLTQQQILETLEYEVKEVANQLSTEEKCIQLLQQLVRERMDNKKYTSAKQVLNALIMLTE